MARIYFIVVLFFSCNMFEHNPNILELEEHEKNLTAKNLRRIELQTPGDTIRFIFTGDTQRFYDDTKAFVDKVNSGLNADFVLISGDISDFGLPAEFRWMNEIYSQLNIPYLTVIGNHDLLGNGGQLYDEMFGPKDYSFQYGLYDFVMVNTNGREYAFNKTIPDTNFLSSELIDKHIGLKKILVSHVPPGDIDFDPALFEPVKEIISGTDNFLAGFNGHSHVFGINYPFDNSIPFISSSSTSKRRYLEISLYRTLNTDTFAIKHIYY